MTKAKSTEEGKVTPVRINWEMTKAKYIKSKHTVLSDFAKEELGIQKLSSFHRRKMNGWLQHKKDIINSAKTEAESELEKQVKGAYEVPMQQLNKLKKGIFDVLYARLSQISDKIQVQTDPETGKQTVMVTGDVPTKELVDILKVVKTELGEATNINQSQLGEEEKNIVREIGSINII